MSKDNIISPKVSIVIPSYNKSDLLIEMIESIINQTYQNWEMIIIDDGSTEEDFQKVLRYISKDNRCSLIRRNREPKNGDTCRNIGMEMSNGDYLLIFDSDDIISPECLERRVAFMQANPDCDYASFPYAVFTNGEKWSFKDVNKVFNVMPEAELLPELLKANYPFTVWSNIYRKESVKEIKWDEQVLVYQDFDFMLSCILAGLNHKFCYGEPDYLYRQFLDGRNVSGNFVSTKKNESTIYLFDKTLDRLTKSDSYEQLKNDFYEFVVLQFHRIMMGGTKDNVNRYIDFVRKYYHGIKFMTVGKLAGMKNGRKKTLFVNYVFGLIFGRKEYIRTANHLLRHRVIKVVTGKS